MLTKQELTEYIVLRYDPDEVIELLELDTEELLKYLITLCYKKQHLFVDESEIWQDDNC